MSITRESRGFVQFTAAHGAVYVRPDDVVYIGPAEAGSGRIVGLRGGHFFTMLDEPRNMELMLTAPSVVPVDQL